MGESLPPDPQAGGRPETLRLLVVSDRKGPPSFLVDLAGNERFRSVGRAPSVVAAAAAVRLRHPHVVVVEILALPQLDELVAAGAGLGKAGVVVVSTLREEVALLTCFAAGAHGFVRAPVERGLLQLAVAAVGNGRTFVDPRSARWLVELAVHGHRSRPESGLTLRQLQVIQLVRVGLTNRQVAQALGVSSETVKTHLKEAMRRLGARDRLEAAALAERVTHP